jgi:DNA mismatch repair protein MSH5
MTEEDVIIIKGGRHILQVQHKNCNIHWKINIILPPMKQEIVVETFVPNDTFVTSEKNIALITGANGSGNSILLNLLRYNMLQESKELSFAGKSVYIKQVGLLVYLAHLGSWLPAEKAIIGLTDWIFARIATVETVSCPQSAFASGMIPLLCRNRLS